MKLVFSFVSENHFRHPIKHPMCHPKFISNSTFIHILTNIVLQKYFDSQKSILWPVQRPLQRSSYDNRTHQTKLADGWSSSFYSRGCFTLAQEELYTEWNITRYNAHYYRNYFSETLFILQTNYNWSRLNLCFCIRQNNFRMRVS